jgi:hypothetical protein
VRKVSHSLKSKAKKRIKIEEAVISFKNYLKGLEFSETKVAYQARAYTIGAFQKWN